MTRDMFWGGGDYEDLEEKADWLTESVNQWINDEAVYRTSPAPPGLLIRTLTIHICDIYIFYIIGIKNNLKKKKKLVWEVCDNKPSEAVSLG